MRLFAGQVGGGQTRTQVIASAVQLGAWTEASMSFVDQATSPDEIQVALTGADVGPESYDTPPGCLKVGEVPGSRFPIIADLRELALHHAALLGVTGTGKTHLSFELVSALAESGTRVVCVDTTGQYRRRFDPAKCPDVPVANVIDFVSQDGGGIALVSLDPNAFSVLQARQLANLLFAWAKKQPTLEDDEPARCVLVFEEAQNYVPEWFVLENNAHKVAAQETSRIIMESRKFGLGFILVSQRTAMITKSALSQCNTIFAFQAVDETSLDYFEGLCGRTLATGLPNLPSRVAISMGRGLLSSRPLIMRTNDADVVIK